ncbi:MAG: DUF962 domain-containing protein [Halieaceae bacterium]|jgi:hypothetical protein|nr:DUF962 domain-containing protein [Halieaceae bacterium]
MKHSDYDSFWLDYLSQHQHPKCRGLHYIGMSAFLLCLFAALAKASWPLLGVGLVLFIIGSVLGHRLFEGNKPAALSAPIWSIYSDWRMFFLFLSGGLKGHLSRTEMNKKSSEAQ